MRKHWRACVSRVLAWLSDEGNRLLDCAYMYVQALCSICQPFTPRIGTSNIAPLAHITTNSMSTRANRTNEYDEKCATAARPPVNYHSYCVCVCFYVVVFILRERARDAAIAKQQSLAQHTSTPHGGRTRRDSEARQIARRRVLYHRVAQSPSTTMGPCMELSAQILA